MPTMLMWPWRPAEGRCGHISMCSSSGRRGVGALRASGRCGRRGVAGVGALRASGRGGVAGGRRGPGRRHRPVAGCLCARSACDGVANRHVSASQALMWPTAGAEWAVWPDKHRRMGRRAPWELPVAGAWREGVAGGGRERWRVAGASGGGRRARAVAGGRRRRPTDGHTGAPSAKLYGGQGPVQTSSTSSIPSLSWATSATNSSTRARSTR